MAGQMGNEKATVLNLKVIDILPEDNAVLISGAVPGSDGAIVIVHHAARSKESRIAGGGSMPKAAVEHSPVKVPLFSASERKGDFEVAGAVFGREGDNSLLHEAVRMQMANRRRGTASTKTKGFISGGGKKPWRQKGTGRARAGSTRSPLWRHGGTIFGPLPRDYSYKMPKKAWRYALCLALSDRAKNGKLVVVESLELAEAEDQGGGGVPCWRWASRMR